MNLQEYRQQKQKFENSKPKYREVCIRCSQPVISCYCEHIKEFDPKIKFVILIHPIEVKRRIATGKMSHLCLKNSELITGQDYSEDAKLNFLLKDTSFQKFVLYPGQNSKNLSQERIQIDQKKKLLIIVIDGTWATARKTMRLSRNLHEIPRICFTPSLPSQFKVRKQPAPECYSTIEAIHQTIGLLGHQIGFNVDGGEHNQLLYVFEKMVEQQLDFIRASVENPNSNSYRRPQSKFA